MELNINIKTSEITDIEAIKAVKTNKENEQGLNFNFDTFSALLRSFAPYIVQYLMHHKDAAQVVTHIIRATDFGNDPDEEKEGEPKEPTEPKSEES